MPRSFPLTIPLNRKVTVMGTARQYTGGVILPAGANIGAKALFFGGSTTNVASGAGSTASTASEYYDDTANSWTAGPALATAEFGATFVGSLNASGNVAILGGIGGAGVPIANAQLYNATNNAVTGPASMNAARAAHAALLDGTNVFTAGGINAAGTVIATAEQAPIALTPWTSKASMITARAGHALIKLSGGKYLAIGGCTAVVTGSRILGTYEATAGKVTALCELYNPTTNTWAVTGSLNYARYGFAAVLLASGQVLVTGGYSDNGSGMLASCELYDPVRGTWSVCASMPIGMANHVLLNLTAAGQTKQYLACGGDGIFSSSLSAATVVGTSAAVFDSLGNTWTSVGPMDVPSNGTTSAALAGGYCAGVMLPTNNDALLVGSTTQAVTDAGLYDSKNKVFSASGTALSAQIIDGGRLRDVSVQVIASSYTATIYFDGSDDTTNWTSSPTLLQFNNQVGVQQVKTPMRYYRARCTAYTAGKPSAVIVGDTEIS